MGIKTGRIDGMETRRWEPERFAAFERKLLDSGDEMSCIVLDFLREGQVWQAEDLCYACTADTASHYVTEVEDDGSHTIGYVCNFCATEPDRHIKALEKARTL